ncbi:V3 [Paper mulberry leaf curling associated virus 1]|uniref:V3 n=1 Tax=Paper mulberry leaf curling associated virus 1 TaxID=2738469 RepID=A0A6M6DT54_9GEMI|nr:V3 [Paper mulberry leaf curling associated virus 1]QJX74404.1 V3 [Paper mulberry leaf curling associated virus 1]QJX74412.1 V3 [Paper mulberry leaf curling associated virus 1]
MSDISEVEYCLSSSSLTGFFICISIFLLLLFCQYGYVAVQIRRLARNIDRLPAHAGMQVPPEHGGEGRNAYGPH